MNINTLEKRIENISFELSWFYKFRPNCSIIEKLKKQIEQDKKTLEFLTSIIKISVFLSNNGKNIEYYVDTRQERLSYNEKDIPGFIIELMNENRIIYHEKDPETGKETFVYSFMK